MGEWIGGRNPVYELLRAGRRHVARIWVAQGVKEPGGRLNRIVSFCRERNIPVERVPRRLLDGVDASHQGVAVEAGGYPYVTLAEIQAAATLPSGPALILILDALQDPQNLGTLLRTAEVVGVHGVLLPIRRSARVTPAVVRASSGASEHLRIAQVNLAQAITSLKQAGVWVVGLEGDPGAQLPGQIHLDVPLALVIGSEGQGMRRLVRDSCDLLMRLPMRGQVDSLNAAVAGSVALYLVWQARGYPN